MVCVLRETHRQYQAEYDHFYINLYSLIKIIFFHSIHFTPLRMLASNLMIFETHLNAIYFILKIELLFVHDIA